MKTSRYTEAQIIAILRQAEGGVPPLGECYAFACRAVGGRAVPRAWHEQRLVLHLWTSLPLQGFLRSDLTVFPGCEHLSGVTGYRCAQMGIPRGEPQQVVGLIGPL